MQLRSTVGYTIVVMLLLCSCQNNKLVGNAYIIKPINDALKLKLMLGMNTITHEYESNHKVRAITYQGKEPIKSEELDYSFDGTSYRIGDEIYNVSFRSDTVILSIGNNQYIDLVPVK